MFLLESAFLRPFTMGFVAGAIIVLARVAYELTQIAS